MERNDNVDGGGEGRDDEDEREVRLQCEQKNEAMDRRKGRRSVLYSFSP